MSSVQGRSSAIRRTVAVLLFAMLLADFAAEAATVVGGKAGWELGQSFGHVTVKRGDSLLFNYNKKAHNVLQVNEENYSSCNLPSKPIRKYSSGKDSIKLSSTGTYYFICGFPGHCHSGMKVAVSVK